MDLVDPVPDPLLLKKNLVAQGIEPGTSDSLAMNSDQSATEAVSFYNYRCISKICIILLLLGPFVV
jgi:hypothetical protein